MYNPTEKKDATLAPSFSATWRRWPSERGRRGLLRLDVSQSGKIGQWCLIVVCLVVVRSLFAPKHARRRGLGEHARIFPSAKAEPGRIVPACLAIRLDPRVTRSSFRPNCGGRSGAERTRRRSRLRSIDRFGLQRGHADRVPRTHTHRCLHPSASSLVICRPEVRLRSKEVG